MRRANNYSTITSPEGTVEQDSFTCGHCQKVVLVQPRQKGEDLGGMCKQCMGLICPACVDKMVCTPWEKQLEQIESRARMLRSIGV